MAEDADQPRARIGNRGLHAITEELRCPGHWVLRRRQPDIRSENAQRFHASIARGIVQEDEATGNKGVSVRELAGEERWPVGCWIDGREDGRMSMAKAGAGGAIRICRVDQRCTPAAQPIYGVARRQEAEGCAAGITRCPYRYCVFNNITRELRRPPRSATVKP